MNILIINGYPGKNGLSRFLSLNYLNTKRKQGHNVKIIHIYDLKFKFITENIYSKKLEKDLQESQEKILWADHLVFFYPVWWVEMPSLLKSFLERILIPGFAFKYFEGKPKKLLNNKTAEVFATAGGGKFYNFFIGKIDQYRTLGKSLYFCGIKLRKVTIFSSIKKDLPEEKIRKIIKKLN